MRTLIAFIVAITCCLVLLPLIRHFKLHVSYSIVVNAVHTAALFYYVSHPTRNRLWAIGVWVYVACIVWAVADIIMS